LLLLLTWSMPLFHGLERLACQGMEKLSMAALSLAGSAPEALTWLT
jgi:hypothetical protein